MPHRSIGFFAALGVAGAVLIAACDTAEINPPAVDAGLVDATSTVDATTQDTGATDATVTDSSTSADSGTDAAKDASATCTIDSTARTQVLSLATTGDTGGGNMTLESAACGTPAAVTYVDKGRGMVPAPSGVDFFVKVDPTDTAKWYPGTTQVFNFSFPGTGDDQDAHLAPKAGTFGSLTVDNLFPGFDANKAHVMMKITALPSLAAPCNAADGYVITVPGHAEAAVKYLLLSANTLSVSTGAAATVTGGSTSVTFVAIEGINPGAAVEISAAKTGCGINAKVRQFSDTGKVPLAAGRVAALSYLATKKP
jgi:hypothetical protein